MPVSVTASLLVSAALLALATGCGGDGGGTTGPEGGEGEATGGPEPDKAAPGVSLVAEPTTVAAGETLQVRVVNETGTRLSYGRGYAIERLVDGGWEPIGLPPQVVPMIGLVAEPGELGPPITVQVPEDAAPGRYRVTLAQPPKGAGSLAAEFEVG